MAPDLLDELPPPQRLALAYAPAKAREATLALLTLDARLAAVLRKRGEAMLAQMRLAWWRDRLSGDPRQWPRGEGVLELLRQWREPAALIPLVDGWEALLGERLDAAAIDEFAGGRATGFAQLAHELGVETEAAAVSARLWALGDLAANLSDAAERAAVIGASSELHPPSLPRALRPLAVLAGLARRSLDRGGAPLVAGAGAAFTGLRLGIFGR